MKKVVLIWCILSSLLLAREFKNHEAVYEISYGIVGEVGEGTASFSMKNGHYKVEIKTETKGLAKFLSKGRSDWMVSEGEIVGDKIIPHSFMKRISTHYKSKTKTYTFYHDKRVIKMHEKVVMKVKELTTMDIVMGKSKKDIAFREKIKEKSATVPFYAKDDLLSLFINLKTYLGGHFEKIKPRIFYALGGDSKDGHIEILTPEDASIKKEFGTDGHIIAVVIHQDIFSSKKGELFIKLNDDGVALYAKLKDVVLFGDVTMKLKSLKVY